MITCLRRRDGVRPPFNRKFESREILRSGVGFLSTIVAPWHRRSPLFDDALGRSIVGWQVAPPIEYRPRPAQTDVNLYVVVRRALTARRRMAALRTL